MAVVLLSFSVYSCGDDDEDLVGSRDFHNETGEW